MAVLFAAAAIQTALTLERSGTSADSIRLAQSSSSVLLGAFGARMAAVFLLSVTTLGLRTRILPRWLVALGYVAAAALFLSPPISGWSQLAFPAWVLTLSVQILFAGVRAPRPDPTPAHSS